MMLTLLAVVASAVGNIINKIRDRDCRQSIYNASLICALLAFVSWIVGMILII